MSGHRALQSVAPPAEQTHRRAHRIYTVAQLLGVDLLNMSKRTFFRLRAKGDLPFLVEVLPRAGRLIRYRADLVDRYLAGQWGQSRFFGAARAAVHVSHRRAVPTSTVSPKSGQGVSR